MSVRSVTEEPVVLDKYGFFSNKSWSRFLDSFEDESVNNDVWFEALNKEGIQTAVLMFEDDAPEELCVEFFETENWVFALKQWKPTPPSDKWFLVSIHDTDDGPCAVFVKYIN